MFPKCNRFSLIFSDLVFMQVVKGVSAFLSDCDSLPILNILRKKKETYTLCTGPRSAVGNVSGNRCESDCRSRGREFDPGLVPYFRGD